jgi:hypothetical protein
MLARLFRHREITYHGAFVSVASGRMAPLPVESLRGNRCKKHVTNSVDSYGH